MTQQEPQHSESRNRVLNASYHLFLRNGLSAVSMQQIADNAGITKATLYHHFRDKHDLYLSTMRLAITRNESALQQRVDDASNLHELTRELVCYLFGDERADLQRLAADFKLHVDTKLQTEFWKDFQLPWRLVQNAIQNLDDVSDDEAIHISRYIFGTASGLSHLYRFEEETYPITDTVLDQLADAILYGISSDPRPR